jgi:Peptidase family M1 domain
MTRFTLLLSIFFTLHLTAQTTRWQQRVNYEMDINMDVSKHQYAGKQKLTYSNFSPDTLEKVFYHLYFNAFQPGSMMDIKNLTIEDADQRVSDRISKLKPNEQGFIKVKTLTQDGVAVKFESNETILEVTLAKPILPNQVVTFDMVWDAQVPIQIRRSGRESKEGIDYSMAQWYPKLCEYDEQGWHSNPYVGREFYGVWGDFDVKITIDDKYVIAAGGYLQNPEEIGYGYEDAGMKVKRPKGKTLTYHFKTPNVHDFVWAADPDYKHTKIKADDGSMMHFFWQNDKGYDKQWEALPAIMNRARILINERFGKYPYQSYSFIQGGDGGMEYPMATLVTGNRGLNSLVGVCVHEGLHSWYQMILGTNESLYAWMDEGFTSYAESIIENELAREGLMSGKMADDNPFEGTLRAYVALAASGKEEPLSTHADYYQTNYAYSLDAYVKGAVFLNQLEYVIGKKAFQAGMLRYFNTWKFKHPNPNDFIRIMEKQSGLELDWYKENWVNTLNTIDYSIKSVEKEDRKSTKITIERVGRMAMPLDIVVTYKDGDKETFYAPLETMRGEKPAEGKEERTTLPDHRYTDKVFSFEIPEKMKKIVKIEIDPTRRMADIDYANNIWEK